MKIFIDNGHGSPQITMGENNIRALDVSSGPGWYTFSVNANVIAYTASYDKTPMRGISLHDIHGGDDQYGIPEPVKLGFGSRDGYTCDTTVYPDQATRFTDKLRECGATDVSVVNFPCAAYSIASSFYRDDWYATIIEQVSTSL